MGSILTEYTHCCGFGIKLELVSRRKSHKVVFSESISIIVRSIHSEYSIIVDMCRTKVTLINILWPALWLKLLPISCCYQGLELEPM